MTQWEDSSKDAILAMADVKDGLGNIGDATEKVTEQQKKNLGQEFTATLRELKNACLPLGEQLLQIAKIALPPIKAGLQGITTVLNALGTGGKATILGLGAALGSLLLSVKAVNTTVKAVHGFIDFYENLKKIKGTIGSVVTGIGNFGSKALSAAKSAGQLAINLGKAAVNFGIAAAKAAIATVKTVAQTVATNALKVAQAALNLVMNMNPIGAVIIAITALIAAIVLLWNKCDWFRNLCLKMFDGLKAAWNVLCNVFKKLWQGVIAYFKVQLYAYRTIFNAVAAGLKAVWTGLCSGLKSLWLGFCNFFKSIFSNSVNFARSIFNSFRYAFSSVTAGIRSAWSSLGHSIKNVWNGVVSGIKNAWNGILSPFRAVANSIGNIWQGIRSMFKLPHFTISGSLNPLNWGTAGPPKIGVQWYYKGGIFNSPTLLGVGDAFNGQGSNAEAVVPLDSMYRKIKDIVAAEINAKEEYFVVNNLMDSNLIAQATYKKINGKLVLDTRRIR